MIPEPKRGGGPPPARLSKALAKAFSLLNPALEAAGFPPKPLPIKEAVELSERMRALALDSEDPERFWQHASDSLAFLDPPTWWQPLDKFEGEERRRALAHAAMGLIHRAALEAPLSKARWSALASEVELLCLDCEDPDEVRGAVAEHLAIFKPPAAARGRVTRKTSKARPTR